MKPDIEVGLTTAAVTYAVVGLCGVIALPVTSSVLVVAGAATAAAFAGAIAYTLKHPINSH